MSTTHSDPSPSEPMAGSSRVQRWSAPSAPFSIDYSLDLMNRLRLRAAENFHALPHGGLEAGGILFGRVYPNARAPLRVEIAAERQIVCSHTAGPAFVLNEEERNEIPNMLERARFDAEIAALSVVGFWVSHGRSGLALTPEDIELYKRFFPNPWQIALVLKPENGMPTRGAFFFRTGSGVSPANPKHEFYADPHLASTPPSAAESTSQPASNERYQPIAREKREGLVTDVALPAAARGSRGTPVAALLLFLTAAAISGAGLTYFALDERGASSSPVAQPYPQINLELFSAGEFVLVHWNAGSVEVENASRGELDLADGNNQQTMPLNLARLRAGFVRIKASSEAASVTLKIYEQNGGVAVVTSRFPEK